MAALEKAEPTVKLHGDRYLKKLVDAGRPHTAARLTRFVTDELPYLDMDGCIHAYAHLTKGGALAGDGAAFLGCNDRFYLLTEILGRKDARHPWLFLRCREVEAEPDGHLDLWARYHFKSTTGTFAGAIQEIVREPDVTICILSCTRDIARAFLTQIQQEIENNEDLRRIYKDVFWQDPRREAPRWSRESGLVVIRKSNPKEATIEAWGLIDGQPTSRHYRLLIYDDVVTQDLVGTPETIKKVTERWELSDNLGTHGSTRKWHFGTRYSFADSYGIILERGTLKARIYPATDDGTLDGKPVLLSPERWAEVKDAQRSTVSAQMLLNPIAGNEAIFRAEWLKGYEIRPTILNVYIMVDPSKGATARSDRTAIAVIGIDVAGNMYLLDGVRHRMSYSERYGHLKRLYLRWSQEIGVQTTRVGYERYGAQTEDEVIRRDLQREGISFELEELAWPRQGAHSKTDRVSRLEPDMRKGRLYLPATVFHPDIGGMGGLATWSVWTQEDEDNAKKRGDAGKHRIGQIVYRPYRGPSKAQAACERTGQGYRIRTAIKAIDEERSVYDLTRAFIEEALFFPFSAKDDLVDSASRIYDMQPVPPVQHESAEVDAAVYPDT